MKNMIFYLLIILSSIFMNSCRDSVPPPEGVEIQEISLDGMRASIEENVTVGTKLQDELYLQNAPPNLANVIIALSGEGHEDFNVSVKEGISADTYIGTITLLNSLDGKGGSDYNMTATATLNGQSLSAPVDIAILSITRDNQPPIAIIGIDDKDNEKTINTAVGAKINGLETYYSKDLDGTISKCEWFNESHTKIKENNNEMCDLYNLIFDTEGTYDYTLKITDNEGAIDTNIAHIIVAQNNIPEAKIGDGDRTEDANSTVSFVASAGDSDNDELEYWWNYGLLDANSYSSTSIQTLTTHEITWDHNFTSTGRYFVEFHVRDEKGAEDFDRVVVTTVNSEPIILENVVVMGSLMWEDTSHTREITLSWTEANTYCRNLRLGGFDNWRLPKHTTSINELNYIMAGTYNDNSKSAIEEYFVEFFPKDNIAYWSNHALDNGSHIVGFFTGGTENFDSFDDNVYVRCIRDN